MNDPLGIERKGSGSGRLNSDAERATVERDEVAWENRQELLRLVRKYDLFIRKDDFDKWRPTVRAYGDIVGIRSNLEIIATDGVLAWFLVEDDFDVWQGHVHHFTGKVETLFSSQPEHKEKKQKLLSPAEKLLKEVQARFAQKRHGE